MMRRPKLRITQIEEKETTFDAVEIDQIIHILECKVGHRALFKLLKHPMVWCLLNQINHLK